VVIDQHDPQRWGAHGGILAAEPDWLKATTAPSRSSTSSTVASATRCDSSMK
jgi:hypothetical protein